ncbi:MAG: cupin-like domain-containing protein [Acidobacteriota bacterium]
MQIERIELPTVEEFQNRFALVDKPVIITKAMQNWKALKLWTIEYLNNSLATIPVQVGVSSDGIFRGDPKDGFKNIKKMLFNEYIELISSPNQTDNKYYLQQSALKDLPPLENDIDFPSYFDKNRLLVANLWLGSGGNTSPLHFDCGHNLLAQVAGRKHITLFSPNQLEFLYPYSAFSKIPHLSQVNIEQPDLLKHPKFNRAKSISCILAPGEIIFIPSFWWHQVVSLEMAISVNFWYRNNPFTYCAVTKRGILGNIHFLAMMVNNFIHLPQSIISNFSN